MRINNSAIPAITPIAIQRSNRTATAITITINARLDCPAPHTLPPAQGAAVPAPTPPPTVPLTPPGPKVILPPIEPPLMSVVPGPMKPPKIGGRNSPPKLALTQATTAQPCGRYRATLQSGTARPDWLRQQRPLAGIGQCRQTDPQPAQQCLALLTGRPAAQNPRGNIQTEGTHHNCAQSRSEF